jgi:ABC-type proline/glycine betaine transport system permease subunit
VGSTGAGGRILAAAVAVSIPLGIWAARSSAAAHPILSIVGVI